MYCTKSSIKCSHNTKYYTKSQIKYITHLQHSKKRFNAVPRGTTHVNYHRKPMSLHVITATKKPLILVIIIIITITTKIINNTQLSPDADENSQIRSTISISCQTYLSTMNYTMVDCDSSWHSHILFCTRESITVTYMTANYRTCYSLTRKCTFDIFTSDFVTHIFQTSALVSCEIYVLACLYN